MKISVYKKYIFSMVLFVWTTQFNSTKSSKSEIGLEYERKKCFVVSILLILLRLKLKKELVGIFGTFSIICSIGRRGLFVLSMNAKVSFIDKLFWNFLQSEEVWFWLVHLFQVQRKVVVLSPYFYLLYCFSREANDRYKHNGIL